MNARPPLPASSGRVGLIRDHTGREGERPRVVCVGDLVVDVSVRLATPLAPGSDTAARTSAQPGGQAGNVAAWLRHAGVDALLVARVGADLFGDYLRHALDARGIELALTVDPDRPTGVCTVLVDAAGERTMLPDPGANAAPIELPADPFCGAALVYLSGYTMLRAANRAAAVDACRAARAARVPIAIDVASTAPLAELGAAEFRRLVGGPALMFANAAEAALLVDAAAAADRAELARALASHYGEAVITDGAAGAWWSDEVQVEHVAAGAARVRDTTGAGDAFAAGLLASRLRGAEPRAALAAGAEIAALAVGCVGAWPAG